MSTIRATEERSHERIERFDSIDSLDSIDKRRKEAMRPDLPTLHGRSLCCCAWLLAAICLAGGRALAQDASTNDQPAVANAVAVPDSEVNTWLIRATDALRAGNQDQALPLLLNVLHADPAVLATTNGVTFLPARKLAGALMRALPERTFTAYRLRTGASPMDLSGRSPLPLDLATLEVSYRNGLPDAARTETGLRLAGLYLDQERYPDARRLLQDLLDEVPTTDASRSDLLARLVVACARVGDMGQAQWAWAELQKLGDTDRWASLDAEIRPTTTPVTPTSNAWTMAYGGPAREAAPALSAPDFGTNGEWMLRWGLNLGSGLVREGVGADNGQTNLPPQLSMSRASATACMMEQNQRPSDDLIFAGNRAWINGFGECVVADLDTGRALQRTAHPASDLRAGVSYGSWVFGNRLNRAASLIGNRVYCVEDNCMSSIGREARERFVKVGNTQVAQPVPCGNVLAAYAADTGRLLWRIGRELPPQKSDPGRRSWRATEIRFAAAPVACGGLLLAPVEDSSGLGVVGLDPESGTAVWRTRLDECIPTWAPRASAVPLTMDGTTAYLCNGRGSVCALDGTDGSVRWTTLYESLADSSATNPVIPAAKEDDVGDVTPTLAWQAPVKQEAMWEESLVLVAGETVLALPVDSDQILAYDRQNGTRLWARRKPDGVDYVVGRRGPALIVAGRRTVSCVDLVNGQERWRTPIEGSTGRGALCGPEVLIPSGRKILRLRAEDGVALGSVRAQTLDNLPLGNLYVNGDQILVAGLERLYALVDARPAFARLQERLAKEPTMEAYAERSRLYAGLGRYTEALTDLREVWKRKPGSAEEESARARLLAESGSATAKEPGAAEALYAAAFGSADRALVNWRLAQYSERAGNTNGALTLYAAILTAPDVAIPVTLGDANLSDANREVSVRQLAAQRIRILLTNDAAKGLKVLEEPAAQALAQLGTAPAWAALVDVATFLPGTAAGREAAFKASRLAAERGDLGMAEAVLQRVLLLSPPPARVALAEELVRLYTERMKWHQGVLRLRDEWPRLGAGAPVPEFLERAAAAQPEAEALPLPPWRLVWRQKGILKNVTYASVRLTPAGLLYLDVRNERARRTKRPLEAAPIGCLSLETGLPRWQRDVVLGQRYAQYSRHRSYGNESGSMHCLVLPGGDGLCIDLWSGATTTNSMIRDIRDEGSGLFVGRLGVVAIPFEAPGGGLAGLDVLTGQTLWRRGELNSLLGGFTEAQPVPGTAAGAVLLSPFGAGWGLTVASPDPTTGEVGARHSVNFNSWDTRMRNQRGVVDDEDLVAPERGDPVLENQRLTVKNLRTGAVAWTSPPDLAIVKLQIMPSGMVLAQTTDEELLLLDGKTGNILRRSEKVRFAFDDASPSMNGDAVFALRRMEGGTNEVVVLDPTVSGIAFRGNVPPRVSPLISLGPTLPDQLLVKMDMNPVTKKRGGFMQTWYQVVNAQGENTTGWRLPGKAESPDDETPYRYGLYIAGGRIVLFDPNSGDALAYEHDPGDGAKK
jgi:outer membrane protein assembly factor BamB